MDEDLRGNLTNAGMREQPATGPKAWNADDDDYVISR
jgi:hypothetical protein